MALIDEWMAVIDGQLLEERGAKHGSVAQIA
jgi:hypothetical protein